MKIEWISYAERKPTRADANDAGQVLVSFADGFVDSSDYDDECDDRSYWAPLNGTEPEPEKSEVQKIVDAYCCDSRIYLSPIYVDFLVGLIDDRIKEREKSR